MAMIHNQQKPMTMGPRKSSTIMGDPAVIKPGAGGKSRAIHVETGVILFILMG